MTQSTLQDQLNQLPVVTLQAGDVLFAQHDSSDAMYVLQRGSLAVTVEANGQQVEVDRLEPDAIVGELGIQSGQPRTASVHAIVPCTLRKISAEIYTKLAAHFPDFQAALENTSQPRWQRLLLAEQLTNLFGTLSAADLQAVQQQLTWRHLTGGDMLCQQGDSAESMFIVVTGRLQYAVHQPDGSETRTGLVGPGETVGESALLNKSTRTATIIALRETDLVELTPKTIDRLTETNPHIMREIARIILDRQLRTLQQATAQPENKDLNLLILPTDPTADLRPFATALAASLAPYGKTLVLDSAEFDAQFGREGAAQTASEHPNSPAIVRWLNEREAAHDFLLLLPDADWTGWTQRCLNYADRVLIVGLADQDAACSPHEKRLMADRKSPLRSELVLLHSAETEHPTGTAAWLADRTVATHHHVRDGDMAHFGRLARRLSGNAIGLTLSGGGARGFVHIGAFQALEEANVPVDYIGGTSFGALIGALRARGWDYKTILGRCKEAANNRLLFDRTLPLVALNKSQKVTQTMRETYGDWQIEDLWIPFFAVASNLSQAKMEILDRGPVWHAVRQSISIPGVFAPVIVDGNIIVDGGVMNNFPVDVVIARSESHRVIGVHCAPSTVKKRQYDLETSVSGWRVLAQRLNPFAKSPRLPSIANTVMRTFDVNSLRLARENEQLCDLLLQPEPGKFSLLDFEAYPKIAAYGYEKSAELVKTWANMQDDLGG